MAEKKLPFFITDHSADTAETGSPDKLRRLYRDIRAAGFSFVRYDWRWKVIQPNPGLIDPDAVMRYLNAAKLMREAGLGPPMVILSSMPDWALKTYKKDPDAFFHLYESYAGWVADVLPPGVKHVQVLNELNNRVYTPIAAEDIPQLCRITRKVLREYNPDIKLVGSVVVGNLAWMLGSSGKSYIENNPDTIGAFDVISLDCYPGVWHQPMIEWLRGTKSYFACHDVLTEAMELLAKAGKAYEIDEVGLPTNTPWLGEYRNELRQRYFFTVFARALKHTLRDFGRRGLAHPVAFGVYEALDEPPRSGLQRVMRSGGWPEHDFGLWRPDGTPKMSVKGVRRLNYGRGTTPRLQHISRYLNS